MEHLPLFIKLLQIVDERGFDQGLAGCVQGSTVKSFPWFSADSYVARYDFHKIVEKRMTQALPILGQLKEWMQQEYPKVQPSLCKALHKLGRKNWLFVGTHDTAQNAAVIYSLFATYKKHDVNPHDWLVEVLRKMNDDGYEGKFSDLLPHRWKSTKA